MYIAVLIACTKMKCLSYFEINKITEDDAKDEILQKFHRLEEIQQDILDKEWDSETAEAIYFEEVDRIFHAVKRREFVCKVDKIAFIDGYEIIAEFWGEYYAKIDFEKYMDKFPELKNLKDPDVFYKVYPDQYHVFLEKIVK